MYRGCSNKAQAQSPGASLRLFSFEHKIMTPKYSLNLTAQSPLNLVSKQIRYEYPMAFITSLKPINIKFFPRNYCVVLKLRIHLRKQTTYNHYYVLGYLNGNTLKQNK